MTTATIQRSSGAPMRAASERSRLIAARAAGHCGGCGKRFAAREIIWYAKVLDRPWEAGTRCRACGRHPREEHSAAPARPAKRRRLVKPARVKVSRSAKPGPLTERYRPDGLAEILGQPAATRFLRKFARAPYRTVLLMEGETGTGKTTAGLALARALGCDADQEELGGVHQIASGEQTADSVREIYRRIWLTPMYGSGWRVVVVNEADRMNGSAETIWLDRLEHLPGRAVLVFTSNKPENLTRRFRDRCTRVMFEADAERLEAAALGLVLAVWRAETGRRGRPRIARQVVAAATEDGKLSFRRVLQGVTVALSRSAF